VIFLKNSLNKEELFSLLTNCVAGTAFSTSKQGFTTAGKYVVGSINSCSTMEICTHEEADTRVHILNALQQGARTIQVKTVDTDIVVILLGQFHLFSSTRSDLELWVACDSGKDFREFSINYLYAKLGASICRALPVLHAYSGCDTTSCFFKKGKKSAWQAWKSYP